jgi:hypothetical protein
MMNDNIKDGIDYMHIAMQFYPTVNKKGFNPSEFGVEFRKGKTVKDINNAIRKGIKNGMSKTEIELDMIALYLQYVFKKKRSNKHD